MPILRLTGRAVQETLKRQTQGKQTEGLWDTQKLLMLCTGLGHFKSGKVVFGKAVQTAHGGAAQGCGHEMSLSLLTPAAASRGGDMIWAGVWSPRSHSQHSGPHFPLLWGGTSPKTSPSPIFSESNLALGVNKARHKVPSSGTTCPLP